jgi:hypothetical protein
LQPTLLQSQLMPLLSQLTLLQLQPTLLALPLVPLPQPQLTLPQAQWMQLRVLLTLPRMLPAPPRMPLVLLQAQLRMPQRRCNLRLRQRFQDRARGLRFARLFFWTDGRSRFDTELHSTSARGVGIAAR